MLSGLFQFRHNPGVYSNPNPHPYPNPNPNPIPTPYPYPSPKPNSSLNPNPNPNPNTSCHPHPNAFGFHGQAQQRLVWINIFPSCYGQIDSSTKTSLELLLQTPMKD